MPTGATVPVLTGSDDPTADAVIDALAAHPVRVARVDTGDFPAGMRLSGTNLGKGRTGSPLITYTTPVTVDDIDPDAFAASAHCLQAADYTPQVAVHHAALLAHVRRTGCPRGAHDLIITATARATDRVLVSTDAQAGLVDLLELQTRLLAP